MPQYLEAVIRWVAFTSILLFASTASATPRGGGGGGTLGLIFGIVIFVAIMISVFKK